MNHSSRCFSLSTLLPSLLLVAVGGANLWAAPIPPESSSKTLEAFEATWQRVLARHLESGEKNGVSLALVDYAALAKGDQDFDRARTLLSRLDPKELSPSESKATWINAYNVLAVAMVVDNYPLESIRDAGGRFFGRVWTQPAGEVGGTTFTLDQIENDILRPMGDPRIHAAIVCASVSCPDLAAEPYTAHHLDEQLDKGMFGFLDNPGKGLRVEGRTLMVSSIFDWFAGDFETSGGVVAVLRKFAPDEMSFPADPKLSFLAYDWQLNGH